jgi:hypothetical protein
MHYAAFSQTLTAEDRIGLPSWREARFHASLDEFKIKYKYRYASSPPQEEEEEEEEEQGGFWSTAFDALLAESEPQKAVVRSELIALLRHSAPDGFDFETDPTYAQEDVLHRAVSLFSHSGFDAFSRAVPFNEAPHCPAIFPYSVMLDEYAKRHGEAWDVNRVLCNRDVVRAALAVLRALGVEVDTPSEAVRGLDGSLVCLCGNPDYRDPMSFTDLVSCSQGMGFSFPRLSEC